MSTVKSKNEAELRVLNSEQLDIRLRDVSTTLAQIRKMKKVGLGNPQIEHALKREKKSILKIQEQNHGKTKNLF
jgi:ribosomal protein L29